MTGPANSICFCQPSASLHSYRALHDLLARSHREWPGGEHLVRQLDGDVQRLTGIGKTIDEADLGHPRRGPRLARERQLHHQVVRNALRQPEQPASDGDE